MPDKVLYLDVFGGIAGDMFVAALLSLGASLPALTAELGKLQLQGYRLRQEAVVRGAFSAVRFVVEPDGTAPVVEHRGHDHSHSHGHDHGQGQRVRRGPHSQPAADGHSSSLPHPARRRKAQ